MIFKITSTEDDFLKNIYEHSMKDLNVFYEINWEHHTPRIIVVDSREIIDELKGEKTENWVVGWSEQKNIYVLNKDSYEKESNHTYSQEEYVALIKHELSHSFYSILSSGHYKPIWLNEGVAIYTSGQNKFKKKPSSFCKFLEYYENGGSDVYGEAGFFVGGLVEKFGKQKLLALIRELKNVKTKEELERLFDKEYGFNLSYDEINAQKFV